MALLTSELERIKAELGYNLIGVGQPYIGTTALFEQAVQPYLSAGAATTSSTAIIGDGTPQAITLASATGFTAGDRFMVDVDGRQETLVAQSLSGTSLTAQFQKTHAGTYPVSVEGGESLVREKLVELWTARATRAQAQGAGALKAIVGDVEYYDSGKSSFASSNEEIDVLRDELAAILGVPNLWRARRSNRLAMY